MDVGIVAQKGNARAVSLADDLRERLRETGVDVSVDDATAARLDRPGTAVDDFDDCDLVVSVGGDGTFLYAARGAGGTPVLGVNLGEVGFLNAVGPGAAEEAVVDAVAALRDGRLDPREVPRLAASGDGWTVDPAVNEVVVQGPRRGHGGGVGYEIRIDGSPYSASHADGVLVATPTGSTAYNLSEGGPLVHPGIDGVVVTEMCSEAGIAPLVVGADSEVRLVLSDADEAVVVSDGRSVRRVEPPTEVRVTTAGPPLRIAGPPADFFQALGKLD